MEIVSIVIDACITVFALGLLLISLLSYRKYKNVKLLFVSLIFFVFFVKGIILSLGLFNEQLSSLLSNPYTGLFDLVVLVLLFVATLKR
jgi:hypothetical protein